MLVLVANGSCPESFRDEGSSPSQPSAGLRSALLPFVRSASSSWRPSLVAVARRLGGAKRARLALDFADDLVEPNDRDVHRPLTARKLDRDIPLDFVDTLAVRYEVRACEDFGRGEALAGAQVVDDFSEQLEANARGAELSGDAQSDDVAESVPLADAAALRGY